ncbi:MAG: hypothetical protein KIG74_04780 [Clostridiaceae bacterium]|nr:hypothetical protein [Clostridiaceae bacterium]
MRSVKSWVCLALVLCLFLSGCSYQAERLLALPRTEESERILEVQAFSLLTGNTVYSIPASGDMTGSSLSIDLTGDGSAETVSCVLKTKSGKQYPCIEIYAYDDGRSSLLTEIPGEGDHIDAVYFPVLDESGTVGVVVGWGLADSSLHGMTVGAFFEGRYEALYSGSYQYLSVADMDQDGFSEIIFVTNDPNSAGSQAIMLNYSEGGIRASAAVPLSQGTKLQSAAAASVGFNRVALLCEGYSDVYGYLTDVILCTDKGELVNVYRSERTGVSGSTARSCPIPCMDANNDGIVELPLEREVTSVAEEHSVHMTLIDWCRCDESTEPEILYTTYYHAGEGWYMRLPDQMSQNVLPVQSVSAEGVSATLFYFLSGEGERGLPLWEIYVLSGENAEETERICLLERLAVSDGKIYALRVYNTIYGGFYTRKSLASLFSLIPSDTFAENSAS